MGPSQSSEIWGLKFRVIFVDGHSKHRVLRTNYTPRSKSREFTIHTSIVIIAITTVVIVAILLVIIYDIFMLVARKEIVILVLRITYYSNY